MLDPRLSPLLDLLAEALARKLQTKNAVAPAKENDGVEDSGNGEYQSDVAAAQVRALRDSV